MMLRQPLGDIKWLTSQKGQRQLVVDNYIYKNNEKGKDRGTVYWVCSSKRSSGCQATAQTNVDHLNWIHEVDNPPDHGHPNDYAEISSRQLKVSVDTFIIVLQILIMNIY